MIDFAVGFTDIKKIGDPVDVDEPLLVIHAPTDDAIASVTPLLQKAVGVG